MLRADGSACLIDFGLAGELSAPDGDAGRLFGTPYYMAPERGADPGLDGRSDLYSAGVLLFELLTGHKPFVAATPAGGSMPNALAS